jgi:hypothetical protein
MSLKLSKPSIWEAAKEGYLFTHYPVLAAVLNLTWLGAVLYLIFIR